jgi:hypothetical protein
MRLDHFNFAGVGALKSMFETDLDRELDPQILIGPKQWMEQKNSTTRIRYVLRGIH